MWKKRICILLSFLMVITGVFPIGFNVNGTVTVSASGISNEETGSTQEPGRGQADRHLHQPVSGGAGAALRSPHSVPLEGGIRVSGIFRSGYPAAAEKPTVKGVAS